MNLEDTVQLMLSDDYTDRFKAELLQLEIRIERLNNMLSRYASNTLGFTPKCTYDELHSQYVHMIDYRNDLLHRQKVEGLL